MAQKNIGFQTAEFADNVVHNAVDQDLEIEDGIDFLGGFLQLKKMFDLLLLPE
jgi:hypothetical protein